MTSVMWGSWVEINPKTAAELEIADGDLVEVATRNGSMKFPAVLYPAIRPDFIAVPHGQGHTVFGRYASSRGVNPAVLGSIQGGSIPAKLTKLGANAQVIRFGTELMEHVESKR